MRIWARDSSNRWCQLWSGPPQRVPHKPRIFSPPLQLCSFKTKLLRLEFNHSLLDYYTELDAVLLIGTSELILPHVGFKNRSLSALLKELGGTGSNNEDVHNLTPDHSKANNDLLKLKNTLHKHCVLYKRYFIVSKELIHWERRRGERWMINRSIVAAKSWISFQRENCCRSWVSTATSSRPSRKPSTACNNFFKKIFQS